MAETNEFNSESSDTPTVSVEYLEDFPIPPVPLPLSIPALPRPLCMDAADRVRQEMRKAIVGQDHLIDMLLVAIISGGHVLLEGVPGTAKTLAVKSLARVFDGTFSRIQFTPDLMPSDIIGTNVFDPRTQQFQFRKGPLFAGMVLADEINRTPPKTQSALLEAMEERRVTVDGTPHHLPQPFLVCATQNPVEYEGTYPLPEAQLDRFMIRVVLDYPTALEEQALLSRVLDGFRSHDLDSMGITRILSAEGLRELRQETESVTIEPSVRDYIVDICRGTRTSKHVSLGASPRASVILLMTSRTLAAINGRTYVTPDDVRRMAGPVLLHRLIIRPDSEVEGYTSQKVLETVIQSIEVPR